MLKENNVRKGFFERDQFEAIRRHLPEQVRPAITFGDIIGWRIKSEVMSLRWDQVDFEAEVVRLEAGTAKNEAAGIYIHERVESSTRRTGTKS